MKLPKNRKVNGDSYQVAIVRSLFIKWMKKKGKWNIYKAEVKGIDYDDAWLHPGDPEDFLGATCVLYDTYTQWCDFVRNNKAYFYNKLSSVHIP